MDLNSWSTKPMPFTYVINVIYMQIVNSHYNRPIPVISEFLGIIFDSSSFFYSILTILKLKQWKA